MTPPLQRLESDILTEVRLAAQEHGVTLFRNNTGMAYNSNGAPVRFGLCKGSSDLIGWAPWGEFVAIEVKRPGQKPTAAQTQFIDAVNRAGGIGFIARSAADVHTFFNDIYNSTGEQNT